MLANIKNSQKIGRFKDLYLRAKNVNLCISRRARSGETQNWVLKHTNSPGNFHNAFWLCPDMRP